VSGRACARMRLSRSRIEASMEHESDGGLRARRGGNVSLHASSSLQRAREDRRQGACGWAPDLDDADTPAADTPAARTVPRGAAASSGDDAGDADERAPHASACPPSHESSADRVDREEPHHSAAPRSAAAGCGPTCSAGVARGNGEAWAGARARVSGRAARSRPAPRERPPPVPGVNFRALGRELGGPGRGSGGGSSHRQQDAHVAKVAGRRGARGGRGARGRGMLRKPCALAQGVAQELARRVGAPRGEKLLV